MSQLTTVFCRNAGHPWDQRQGFDTLVIEGVSRDQVNTIASTALISLWSFWLSNCKSEKTGHPSVVMYRPCDITEAWHDSPTSPHPGKLRAEGAPFTEKLEHDAQLVSDPEAGYWERLFSREPVSLEPMKPSRHHGLALNLQMPSTFQEFQPLIEWPTKDPFRAALNYFLLSESHAVAKSLRDSGQYAGNDHPMREYLRDISKKNDEQLRGHAIALIETGTPDYHPANWMYRLKAIGYLGTKSQLITLANQINFSGQIDLANYDWDAASAQYKSHRTAVQENGLALRNVPEKYLNSAICLSAVVQNGNAILMVPKKFLTQQLCLECVKAHGYALQYVPHELRSPQLLLAAVSSYGRALNHIVAEQRALDLCIAAVTQCNDAMYFVPKALRSQVRNVVSRSTGATFLDSQPGDHEDSEAVSPSM